MQQLYDQMLESIKLWEQGKGVRGSLGPLQYMSKPVLVIWDRTSVYEMEGWALASTLSTVTLEPDRAHFYFYCGLGSGCEVYNDFEESQSCGYNNRWRIYDYMKDRVDCHVDLFLKSYNGIRQLFTNRFNRMLSIQRIRDGLPFEWTPEDAVTVWITFNYAPDGKLPDNTIVMDLAVKSPQQWLDWWIERHPEVFERRMCHLL